MISPLAMVGGEFLYHIRTRFCMSVVNCEKLTNFVVLWVFIPSATTYLMKVYSLLSLTRNLENFTTKRITTALISCIVMWQCILFAHSRTIQVWGLVIVYF